MTTWIRGICETNGISLHYLRTRGAKPPVVLLHGLMGNGACWTPLARALEDEFDVVMPDARGHGGSTAPHHGYRTKISSVRASSGSGAAGLAGGSASDGALGASVGVVRAAGSGVTLRVVEDTRGAVHAITASSSKPRIQLLCLVLLVFVVAGSWSRQAARHARALATSAQGAFARPVPSPTCRLIALSPLLPRLA